MKGIICTAPLAPGCPRRSEKRNSVRASRRAILSSEKLSMRLPNSIDRCTSSCTKSDRQLRPARLEISSISVIVHAHDARVFDGNGNFQRGAIRR